MATKAGGSQVATDPTLDRLLRHMAWANAALIARLQTLDDAALTVAAPRNEWTVAMILNHLVRAASIYVARLESMPRPPQLEPLTTVAQLAGLSARCAASDARLHEQAAQPDGTVIFVEDDSVRRARSTILAQAIHHATEHRAQIAEALATNGISAVDLDALDVWE